MLVAYIAMGKKRKINQASAESKRHKTSAVKDTGATEGPTLEDKLAKSDPEFVQFLKDEGSSDMLGWTADELSASSSDEADDDNGARRSSAETAAAVAVTDEDAVDDDEEEDAMKLSSISVSKKTVVTTKMVQRWSRTLCAKASVPVMLDIMDALVAALHHVGRANDRPCKFRVTGSAEFNAVTRTCIQDLVPAIHQHLNLPQSKGSDAVLPSASPQWKKIRLHVKAYVGDVIELLDSVGSVDTVRSVLKHILDLVSFSAPFPKLSKTLLKKLVVVWSENSDEKNRIVAVCAIHRLLFLSRGSLLERGFKLLYSAYVRNAKFTSPTTLPFIQLMQRSLVEIGRIDISLTYRHAFVYIRQLAIHLRNAVTVKKKETMQTVYNWQFIHCLSLWTRLVGDLHHDESVQSLVYPLTQTIVGTIRLAPTAQYYPLRFLCVRELNKLALKTSTHIPVLPFLMEVLQQVDQQRKVHGGKAKSSFSLRCVLKLSKAQLNTKAYRDSVIDQLHELIFEYLNIHAHTIGFPELALPILMELRHFVKSCKIPAYTRKMKELIGKITETSAAITERRQAATLNLQDLNAVALWESKSREAGTPLSKYYSTWRKLRDQQLQAEMTVNMAEMEQQSSAASRKKRKAGEMSSDFDEDELAALARSASDNDDEEEEEDEMKISSDENDAGTDVAKRSAVSDDGQTNRINDSDSDDDDSDDVVENISLSDSDIDESE